MLAWVQHRWTSLWLVTTAIGALCLFLYGFFPLKYHSGKMAHMDDLPNFIGGVSIDGQAVYNSGENTVVLMVIDGLRYDFVTEEYMPFTGQILKNKSACIYVSVAEPPTVTMPRIKAMMTGSISTFADVALNFGAPAVQGDSVLRVAKSRGLRSILYGDDTWLRLFPGLWAEADGTTSFFVTDYTEVDNNITRHLDRVLTPDDKNKPTFDFLVLHYLGLDHIGHLEGARSPKIRPKLIEMDDIIKKIYAAMQKWDKTGTLIVCGDHGMRDAGGHGGASPAEVLVPLAVIRSKDFTCPYPSGPGPTVSQVDVAPTISWLLNCPIPGDSVGIILPSLMPRDMRQNLYLLHVLTRQIEKQISTDTEMYKQYIRAENQFANFLSKGHESAGRIAKEFYEESLHNMAKFFTETTSDFDMFAILMATVCLYLIVVAMLCITLFSFQPEQKANIIPYFHHRSNTSTMVVFAIIYTVLAGAMVTSCFITETKSRFCSFNPLWSVAFVVMATAITVIYFIIKTCIERTKDLSMLNGLDFVDYFLIFGTVLHVWSLFGTSFIEEEHMTWHFLWNTLMLVLLLRNIMILVIYLGKKWSGSTEVQEKPALRRKMCAIAIILVPLWVAVIGLHRYLKTMNQTGDRWLFLPDTADWLNAPEHIIYLDIHCFAGTILTYLICMSQVGQMNNLMQMHSAFTTVAISLIMIYRMSTGSMTFIATITTDPVIIVNIFWGVLVSQLVFEILSYIGVAKFRNKFGYTKLKEKNDYILDPEPNTGDAKLKLANSITHIMYNDLMMIVILLMRPHNVIMVPSIFFTSLLTSICLDHKLVHDKAKNTAVLDLLCTTLVHIWIGMLFFFYQGNSNSLASVDLGSGYVGLREYSAVRVALRMGLHAYAGPALSGASLFCLVSRGAANWNQYLTSIWRVINIFVLQRVYQLFVYCIIAMIFRHHLFVWTVFSPKLLYEFVATVFTLQSLATIGLIVLITHAACWLAKLCTRN